MNISRSILLLLCLLGSTCVSAQGFFKTYAPTFSTARDVVQTDNGDYFMVGHIDDDSLLFLQKVDPAGQLVWAIHFGFNKAKAIATTLTDDGGFAVLTEFYADTNGYKNAVLKISATGTVVWSQIIDNYLLPNGLRDMVATNDGGFLLVGDTRDTNINFNNWLVKLASDGSIAWQETYGTGFHHTSRVVALADGTFVVSGGRNGGNLSLTKVNATGDLIWEKTFNKPSYQRAFDLLATSDGGFALLGTTQNSTPSRLEISILKTDGNGNEQWFNALYPYTWPTPSFYSFTSNIFAQDLGGNFYIPIWDGIESMELLKLDPLGNELWKKEMPSSGNAWAIIRTLDQYFAIAGESTLSAMLLKVDGEGEIFGNKIRGQVFRDLDADCALGAGEVGLNNFIVVAATPNEPLFFKRTNADGTYELRVPEGNYDVWAKPAYGNPAFYDICDTLAVSVVGANQTIENQMIGMEALAECPMLEVEVGQGLLRRCMNSDYTISICNYGNSLADNPSVVVTADTALHFVSSTMPVESQNGNVYTFNMADLPPGECTSFNIKFLVDCSTNVGDVICVEAHAYPDSTCLPPGANWDGSEIEVTGVCENDQISFKIKNKGLAPMSQTLDYVIIEDHIMYSQGSLQLAAGADSTIVIPNPNGACYLGKVYNGNSDVSIISRPTAVVENCISGGNLDLALQFETGENNYAISTSCSDVIGSFDPNDKRGFPLGWKDEHLLEANEDIEYLIRFQNTGNDTAFLVVVRDTLPLTTLDPSSVRLMAASHECTWDVSGNGLAAFTFANILLPDSTTNEPASHGFVRFRIRQQPDLADGTRIENSAAIFFDFNEPVITNEYFHTIGSPIVLVTHLPNGTQLLDFQVLPNPFIKEATFVLKGYSAHEAITFRLIDALGNVVREERFPGNTFLFNAQNLPTGMYFFQMEENGLLLTTGKVVLTK